MSNTVSALYRVKQSQLHQAIARHLERGIERATGRPLLFFRADDIGIGSHRFEQMIGCFRNHRLPLCLATVPAWLNEPRLNELRRLTGTKDSQWCWHQHGYRHRNFAPTGKKQEFSALRDKDDLYTSLNRGKEKLERLLGPDFEPIFTPPWNRCSGETLEALVALGFSAVSRSRGAQPETPPQLPDFQVNVDLHTRKETDPRQSLINLLTEIEQALASGLCGIMLHHQRMNGAALELLDILLQLMKNTPRLQPVRFTELIKK